MPLPLEIERFYWTLNSQTINYQPLQSASPRPPFGMPQVSLSIRQDVAQARPWHMESEAARAFLPAKPRGRLRRAFASPELERSRNEIQGGQRAHRKIRAAPSPLVPPMSSTGM